MDADHHPRIRAAGQPDESPGEKGDHIGMIDRGMHRDRLHFAEVACERQERRGHPPAAKIDHPDAGWHPVEIGAGGVRQHQIDAVATLVEFARQIDQHTFGTARIEGGQEDGDRPGRAGRGTAGCRRIAAARG